MLKIENLELIEEKQLKNIIGGSNDGFFYLVGDTAHRFLNSPIKGHQSRFTGNKW
ncbi:hypothetical protein [Leuconostoc gelidum]|uniref:hypothetical protein n=1 Tax=Leuconostoc gelidum TaxID=1244 RepID=UPI00021920DF|nr:hypothetical protein [Leuconostoc gelidum]MBZ5992185.1 hypothetical protein [Leuconostoc gelidum subsp. gelidum]USP17348.1 hypothetical protein J4766_00585 [Leuconostoc gelidum subsp. aenigmaticum]GMA67284.1 hypothetical protein GCM10025884_09110 [Leuconostoc gelidum subsp. gelidum]